MCTTSVVLILFPNITLPFLMFLLLLLLLLHLLLLLVLLLPPSYLLLRVEDLAVGDNRTEAATLARLLHFAGVDRSNYRALAAPALVQVRPQRCNTTWDGVE